LQFPKNKDFVSLRHADEYPMNEGTIISSEGIDAAPDEFDRYFEERQVPYSNALQANVKGRGPYFLGPLARANLNFDHLGPEVVTEARGTGIPWAQLESVYEHCRACAGDSLRDRRGDQDHRLLRAAIRTRGACCDPCWHRVRNYRSAPRLLLSCLRSR